MAASSRTLLSELPTDHEFSPPPFLLTREYVEAYVSATRDTSALYDKAGLAPPLAVATRALGALLEVVELPPGSLHTGQEIEMQTGVPMPANLTLSGRVAQRSERGGMIIAVLQFDVTANDEAEPALTGRTTVMMPQKAEP
jgi:hypothetical protein